MAIYDRAEKRATELYRTSKDPRFDIDKFYVRSVEIDHFRSRSVKIPFILVSFIEDTCHDRPDKTSIELSKFHMEMDDDAWGRFIAMRQEERNAENEARMRKEKELAEAKENERRQKEIEQLHALKKKYPEHS